MEIKQLKLVNFRNYNFLDVEFNKKNTIFIGNNAQGKTNILEAIYVLGLTKSFFNINEKNLIKFDELYSKIQGTIIDNNIEKKLEIIINKKGKKVKIDNQDVNKLSNYISKLNVIIFSPDNIRLLKESPSYRRRYINTEISQLNNSYIRNLNDFNKLLKQRNEYLKYISKNKIYDDTYLEVIDRKFASLSINIYLERKKFIKEINDNLSKIYFNITGFENLIMKYVTVIEESNDINEMIDDFYRKLKLNLDKDILYGMSLIGPHRDDFCLELDNKNILLYGSQGQNRCAILSLKFAEIPIFKKVLGVNPVLLLDDIFSELDANKKNSLIKFIPKDVQTIITTTDLSLIDKEVLNNSSVFTVKDGKISDD